MAGLYGRASLEVTMTNRVWSRSGIRNESNGGPLWPGKASQRGKLCYLPIGALPMGFLSLFLPLTCPFDCLFGCSVPSPVFFFLADCNRSLGYRQSRLKRRKDARRTKT